MVGSFEMEMGDEEDEWVGATFLFWLRGGEDWGFWV